MSLRIRTRPKALIACLASVAITVTALVVPAQMASAMPPPPSCLTFDSNGATGVLRCSVPQDVSRLQIDLLGAGGGGGGGAATATGGAGASVTAVIDVTPGDVLTIEVGTGGGASVGDYDGGGGGGWTAVKDSGGSVLAVAGGGGGGGSFFGYFGESDTVSGGDGAAAATADGGAGSTGSADIQGGGGGTLSAGGAGGKCVAGCGGTDLYDGSDGAVAVGGKGGDTFYVSVPPNQAGQGGNGWQGGAGGSRDWSYALTGGGGGTGYFGGGGGAEVGFKVGAGGGAGSSFAPQGATFAPGTNGGAANTAGGSGSAVLSEAPAAAPTVTAITPDYGPVAGGTTVTITGTGFVDGATVDFDGSAATNVTFVDDTTITAETPAGTVGEVDVTVTNPDSQTGTAVDAFTYGYKLSQNTGTVAPGASVTYTTNAPGTYQAAFFVDGVFWASGSVGTTPNPFSWCFFGGATTKVGTYRVYDRLNAGAPRPAWGDPYAATIDTTFTGAPAYACGISAVSPTSGPAAGGGTITITGGGFQQGATVSIGANAATNVTVVDDTTITATIPAGTAGQANVRVSNPATAPFTKTNAYTYIAPAPTVSTVSPNSGSTAGGTSVIIAGSGFANGASVLFGRNRATNVTVVDDTTITATTPAGTTGTVDVTVTNSDSQSGTAVAAYTYTAPTPDPGPGPGPGPSPQPTPTPVPLPSALTPGGSLLLVDGVPQPVTVTPKSSDTGLQVEGDGWSMDLDGLGPDGKPLNLGPNGALILDNDRQVRTSGAGFLGESEVALYLDPPVQSATAGVSLRGLQSTAGEGTYVGTVKTDAQGSFAGTVTLPAGIAPGNHVLQAVGYSPSRQVRAMNLGVIVQRWIVLDKGVRKADGLHDRVTTSGTTGGIDPGTRLTPHVKLSGQSAFKTGVATITVKSDGTFTWSRLVRTNKRMMAYVSYLDTNSNQVTWVRIR